MEQRSHRSSHQKQHGAGGEQLWGAGGRSQQGSCLTATGPAACQGSTAPLGISRSASAQLYITFCTELRPPSCANKWLEELSVPLSAAGSRFRCLPLLQSHCCSAWGAVRAGPPLPTTRMYRPPCYMERVRSERAETRSPLHPHHFPLCRPATRRASNPLTGSEHRWPSHRTTLQRTRTPSPPSTAPRLSVTKLWLHPPSTPTDRGRS